MSDSGFSVNADVVFTADEASLNAIAGRVSSTLKQAMSNAMSSKDIGKDIEATMSSAMRALTSSTSHGSVFAQLQQHLTGTAVNVNQLAAAFGGGAGGGGGLAGAITAAAGAINPFAAAAALTTTTVIGLTGALRDNAAAWQEAVRKAQGFSITMGVSVKEGARLNNFFNEFGISADRATQILRRMDIAVNNGAFRKLGIQVQTSANGMPDMVKNLLAISEAYQKANNAADRANVLKTGLGIRGGGGVGADGSLTQLAIMMQQGPERLRAILQASGGDIINSHDVDKMNALQMEFRHGSENARQFHEEIGKATVGIQHLAAEVNKDFFGFLTGLTVGTSHTVERFNNILRGEGPATDSERAQRRALEGIANLAKSKPGESVFVDQRGLSELLDAGKLTKDQINEVYQATLRSPGVFGPTLTQQLQDAAAGVGIVNARFSNLQSFIQDFAGRLSALSSNDLMAAAAGGDDQARTEVIRRITAQQKAMIDLPEANSSLTLAQQQQAVAQQKANEADKAWNDRNKKSRSDVLEGEIQTIEHAKAARDAKMRQREAEQQLQVTETQIARFREDEPRRTAKVTDAEEALFRARRAQSRVALDLRLEELQLDRQRVDYSRSVQFDAVDAAREQKRANEDLIVAEQNLTMTVVDGRQAQLDAIKKVMQASRDARAALDELNNPGANLFKASGHDIEKRLAAYADASTPVSANELLKQQQSQAASLVAAQRQVEDALVRVRNANFAVADVTTNLALKQADLTRAENAMADDRRDKVIDAANGVRDAQWGVVDALRAEIDAGPDLARLNLQLERDNNTVRDSIDDIRIAKMRDEATTAKNAENEAKRIKSLSDARVTAHAELASAVKRTDDALQKTKDLKFIINGGTQEELDAQKAGKTLDQLLVAQVENFEHYLNARSPLQVAMELKFPKPSDQQLADFLAQAANPSQSSTPAFQSNWPRATTTTPSGTTTTTTIKRNEFGGNLRAGELSWVNEARPEFAMNRRGEIQPILGGPQIRSWNEDVTIIPSVAALSRVLEGARFDRPSIGNLVLHTGAASAEGITAAGLSLAHAILGVG